MLARPGSSRESRLGRKETLVSLPHLQVKYSSDCSMQVTHCTRSSRAFSSLTLLLLCETPILESRYKKCIQGRSSEPQKSRAICPIVSFSRSLLTRVLPQSSTQRPSSHWVLQGECLALALVVPKASDSIVQAKTHTFRVGWTILRCSRRHRS